MNEKELLKLCRYYKGEENNPFDSVDQNKAMLWFYERAWFSAWLKKNGLGFDEMIADYVGCGLASFESKDGIPITLKALLFNRYAQTAQSQRQAVEPFKSFFLKYYK